MPDLLRRQERSVVLPDGEEVVERRLSASTLHQHYRTLKTFCRWMVDTELLDKSPLRVKMKPPRTLPVTPDDDTVALLLKHAGEGFYGLYSDTGLRLTELLRVCLSDVNHVNRTIRVVGKGEVDDVAPFGEESATRLKEWMRKYRWNTLPDAYLITSKGGKPLHADSVVHLLHDVSRRAGLPRLISAHKLRHYFGTQVLIQTGDLELTRQLLRHRTLTMSLQYARLTKTDVLKKFRMASPLDHLKRRH